MILQKDECSATEKEAAVLNEDGESNSGPVAESPTTASSDCSLVGAEMSRGSSDDDDDENEDEDEEVDDEGRVVVCCPPCGRAAVMAHGIREHRGGLMLIFDCIGFGPGNAGKKKYFFPTRLSRSITASLKSASFSATLSFNFALHAFSSSPSSCRRTYRRWDP